jgi:hypothetical protein
LVRLILYSGLCCVIDVLILKVLSMLR